MEDEYEFVQDSQYESLIAVDSTKGNGVYQVRVLRKWKVVDPSRPSTLGSVDLVLIDIHGIKIQASIGKDILHLFDEKLIEGRVYCVSVVDVRFNLGSLRPTYHRYKFVFTEATVVVESTNSFIPDTGLSLIGSKDVKEKRESFKYMVDVIGMVTAVNHDKDFFPDGTVRESVTFKLHDERRGFLCEFTGKLVEEFINGLGSSPDGLPIVLLQFVKLGRSEGSVLVEGIEGVTRLFVNPIMLVGIEKFKKFMVQYLCANFDYSGLYRSSSRLPVSISMAFLRDFPVRNVHDLITNLEVGYYVVNARICEIVAFDPWWYPMCDCARVFRGYIGEFKCVKCQAPKFTASPKVQLTFRVDDETGSALFRAFDNVMINVAGVRLTSQGISADTFYDAFKDVLGKSIMFIVRKDRHAPFFADATYQVVRVADSQSLLDYFMENGYTIVSSKVVERSANVVGRELAVVDEDNGTNTVEELMNEYQPGINSSSNSGMDVASSSRSKRSRDDQS